jgi:serine/threonine protein kinase
VSDDVLGRYRLLERIGVGGMAEVFLARAIGASSFTRTVVVKRMLPQLAADADAVVMFLDEARLGAKLQHQNIVGVLDLGEVGGAYFMVLEYVDGADLGSLDARARARKEPIPCQHACYVVAQAALGLHAAHEARDPETKARLNVVHRDVSLSNVLVSRRGDVKLADFGVARSSAQAARTATGAIKGKLSYMSPEQVEAKTLDGRSDLYSLGVVLWELLVGRRLHDGKSEVEILKGVLKGDPPRVSTLVPAVDKGLDDLVASLLARSPDARPATGRDVADALDRIMLRENGGRAEFELWLTREAVLFDTPPPAPHAQSAPMKRTPVASAKALHPASTPKQGDGGTAVLRKVKGTPSSSPSSSSTPKLTLARVGPDRKRELVLYVEDEPENRDVAELRLKRSYELLLASTDEEACAILRERGADLAAILMDIQLKGSQLDGIELVRLVRGTLADNKKPAFAKSVPVLDVPILFVTAYGSRYAEPELLAAGAQKLVTKPVNFAELTLALVDLHLKRATKP